MVRIRLFFLVLLVLNFAEFIHAQSAKGVVENLKKKYSATNDAIVSFEQTVKYPVSKMEQKFSGMLYFKRKNKYRIETDQQVLVTDGNTTWLYSKVNKQVIIDRFKEDRNTISPEKFLLSVSDDYIPAIIKVENQDSRKIFVLKLTPKDEDSFVESAKVWVADGDWHIARIEISDVNGVVTTYIVKNFKLNTGIDDAIFRLEIPSGVKVVDLR